MASWILTNPHITTQKSTATPVLQCLNLVEQNKHVQKAKPPTSAQPVIEKPDHEPPPANDHHQKTTQTTYHQNHAHAPSAHVPPK